MSLLEAWPGLRLIERVPEGNRGEVWRGELDGDAVAVRRSRRSPASLAWELDTIEAVARSGIGVAEIVPTATGSRSAGSIVVQRWVDGRPPETTPDWVAVAATLAQVHRVVAEQRPDASVVTELTATDQSVDAELGALPAEVRAEILDVFAAMADVPVGLVHGDPNPSNIRLDETGRVWLLDWDESRVDLTWHDLSNLGVQVLADDEHQRALVLSHAWEVANAWVVEPNYARRRLELLRSARELDSAPGEPGR